VNPAAPPPEQRHRTYVVAIQTLYGRRGSAVAGFALTRYRHPLSTRSTILQNLETSVPLASSTGEAGIAPAFGPAAHRVWQILLLVAALAVVMALAGCASTRGGPIPYDTHMGAPDSTPVQGLEEDYKISPLDTLHIAVFQVPELTGDFDVDLTGTITMPLVGSVHAVGLTTAQLDQKLTQALGEKYLQHPDVSVGVKSSSSRNITVDGSVKAGGQFAVTGHLTLIQAIALAHGTDDNANPHRVAIFRQIKGQRMAAAFDLTSIRRGEAEDPPVYSGDIIVVDGSKVKGTWQSILQTLPLVALFHPFGI
jgi:polysaccharide export outer membrane protein